MSERPWWYDSLKRGEDYFLHGRKVTEAEYFAGIKANVEAREAAVVVCGRCGKKADVGQPCWWCGHRNLV